MKKLIVVSILLVFSTFLFGKDGFSGESGIGAGVVNVNGENKFALRLNFNPEFKVSKLSIGARVALYMGDGIPVDVNGDGKENFDDVEFGIRYLEWDGDIVKFRYGTFDDFTLGHGTLVYNYSNNEKTSLMLGLQDKEKRAGAKVFFPLKKDIFGADIDEKDQPKAMGGRVFVRPLKLVGVNAPIVKNIELGVTYAEDVRDKYNRPNGKGALKTTTVGSEEILTEYAGNVKGIAYEVSLPLIEDVIVPYYNRVEVEGERDLLEDGSTGKSSEKVSGDFIGVIGKLSVLNYKFEYRNIDYGLTPGYFGRLYEVRYNENLDRVLDKKNNEKVSGYFGELGANLGGVAKLTASYEDYDKDDIKPHIFGELDVTPSEKFKAKLTYDQINLGSDLHEDDFLNDDTVIKAKIVAPASMIGIPGPFLANVDIKQTYSFNEKESKYIPSRVYTVGLSFYW